MNEHFVSVPEPEYEALCAAKDAAEKHLAGTRAMLRIECEDLGDNDWSDDLHLADVVEKHLARPVHAKLQAAEARVRVLEELVAAKNAMIRAYRVGAPLLGEKALTRIEEAEASLAALEAARGQEQQEAGVFLVSTAGEQYDPYYHDASVHARCYSRPSGVFVSKPLSQIKDEFTPCSECVDHDP